MKRISLDRQGGQLFVGHLNPGFVSVLVEAGPDFQALPGRGSGDQVHHHFPADQGTPSPVGRDVAEHPVLDLVPVARSRWKVAHLDRKGEIVGQFLDLPAPQADAVSVASSPVGGDQQPTGRGIDRMPHLAPPSPNALHGKFGGVVVDADIDPSGIGRQVVDPVGGDLSQIRIDEVVDADLFGASFRLPFPARILEVSDEFLLFRVDGDDGIAGPLVVHDRPGDVLELSVPAGMRASFPGLAHRLKAVPHLLQESVDRSLADGMAFPFQFFGQSGGAFAGPAERRHRIAPRDGIDEGIKIPQKRVVLFDQFLAPASRCPDPSDRSYFGLFRNALDLSGRKFRQSGINGRPGKPDGPGHRAHTPVPQASGFHRRPETEGGFVQNPGERPVFLGDDCGDVLHGSTV